MLGVLDAILCWIKQIGAMFLSGAIQAVNAVFAAIGAAGQLVLDTWPVGMPSLPELPQAMVTGFGWVKWGPIPLTAMASFMAFSLTVLAAWWLLSPMLRWLKVTNQ